MGIVSTTEYSDPCYCGNTYIDLNDLDEGQTFQSPQYPKNYCSDTNCKWFVTAKEGFALQVDWIVFSLELNMDYVYIRDGHDPNSPLLKECTGWKCGNQRSSANKVQLHFRSDHVTTDLGFRVRVTAIRADGCYCSESLTIDFENLMESFTILSPKYPDPYCPSHNCHWTFIGVKSYGLHIAFKTFDIKSGQDFLKIYDGLEESPETLFAECTGVKCSENTTSDHQMHITFVTDAVESTNTGFQGIVTVVRNYCDQGDISSRDEGYIRELSFTNPRADGFIPAGGTATLICSDRSKLEGTIDSTINVATCESPKWSKDLGVCVPTCNVELNVPGDFEHITACKWGHTQNEPLRMMESGETVKLVKYDFLQQQEVSEVQVVKCSGTKWIDQNKNMNYPDHIKCDIWNPGFAQITVDSENCFSDPKILFISSSLMELYYPTDPSRNRRLTTTTVKPRDGCTAAMISDGSLMICGGTDITANPCERYFPKEDKILDSEPLNTLRFEPASVVLDGVMYLCGGSRTTKFDDLIPLASCERYIPNQHWEYISPMTFKRFGLTMVVYDGRVIAVGGISQANTDLTVEAYSPDADTWSAFANLNEGREFAAAGVFNGHLYVCGGFKGNFQKRKSCESYNSNKNKWEFAAEMQQARFQFRMITLGDRMYAVAGGNNEESVEMFDGTKWTTLSAKIIKPTPTSAATAVLLP